MSTLRYYVCTYNCKVHMNLMSQECPTKCRRRSQKSKNTFGWSSRVYCPQDRENKEGDIVVELLFTLRSLPRNAIIMIKRGNPNDLRCQRRNSAAGLLNVEDEEVQKSNQRKYGGVGMGSYMDRIRQGAETVQVTMEEKIRNVLSNGGGDGDGGGLEGHHPSRTGNEPATNKQTPARNARPMMNGFRMNSSRNVLAWSTMDDEESVVVDPPLTVAEHDVPDRRVNLTATKTKMMTEAASLDQPPTKNARPMMNGFRMSSTRNVLAWSKMDGEESVVVDPSLTVAENDIPDRRAKLTTTTTKMMTDNTLPDRHPTKVARPTMNGFRMNSTRNVLAWSTMDDEESVVADPSLNARDNVFPAIGKTHPTTTTTKIVPQNALNCSFDGFDSHVMNFGDMTMPTPLLRRDVSNPISICTKDDFNVVVSPLDETVAQFNVNPNNFAVDAEVAATEERFEYDKVRNRRDDFNPFVIPLNDGSIANQDTIKQFDSGMTETIADIFGSSFMDFGRDPEMTSTTAKSGHEKLKSRTPRDSRNTSSSTLDGRSRSHSRSRSKSRSQSQSQKRRNHRPRRQESTKISPIPDKESFSNDIATNPLKRESSRSMEEKVAAPIELRREKSRPLIPSASKSQETSSSNGPTKQQQQQQPVSRSSRSRRERSQDDTHTLHTDESNKEDEASRARSHRSGTRSNSHTRGSRSLSRSRKSRLGTGSTHPNGSAIPSGPRGGGGGGGGGTSSLPALVDDQDFSLPHQSGEIPSTSAAVNVVASSCQDFQNGQTGSTSNGSYPPRNALRQPRTTASRSGHVGRSASMLNGGRPKENPGAKSKPDSQGDTQELGEGRASWMVHQAKSMPVERRSTLTRASSSKVLRRLPTKDTQF